MLQKIENSSRRMRQLVQDILNYSRLGNEAAQLVATTVASAFLTVLDDLDEVILSSGAVIATSGLDAAPVVVPSQLRQLLHNLLSNALKYKKHGTLPHITCTATVLQLSALPEGLQTKLTGHTPSTARQGRMYCMISMKDNGIGIDAGHTDQIFQIFHRLHSQEAYVGTGIGLALCKRIAENHQGAITLNSATGAVSEFLVAIPMQQKSVKETAE